MVDNQEVGGINIKRKYHRHCGGQPGNQNARKHGFYTFSLSPAERAEFLNLTEKEGIDQPLALLRIRIKSIMENDPANHCALSHALKLLSDWVVSQSHLGPSESQFLRKYIRTLFEEDILDSYCHVQNPLLFNKTIESGPADDIEKMTKRTESD